MLMYYYCYPLVDPFLPPAILVISIMLIQYQQYIGLRNGTLCIMSTFSFGDSTPFLWVFLHCYSATFTLVKHLDTYSTLAIGSIGYDNIELTKVIAKTLEHDNLAKSISDSTKMWSVRISKHRCRVIFWYLVCHDFQSFHWASTLNTRALTYLNGTWP